jgi:NADH:ubiquinone oxidoreductase subunit F (NADH-binding)
MKAKLKNPNVKFWFTKAGWEAYGQQSYIYVRREYPGAIRLIKGTFPIEAIKRALIVSDRTQVALDMSILKRK